MRSLLLLTMMCLVDSELTSRGQLQKVDEPIPLAQVSAVTGYAARLPCDLAPGPRGEEPFMLFWYRNEHEGAPIYSVDGRSKPLSQGKQWSNPKALGDRASVRFLDQRAELQIDKLMPEDAGLYRCRIDFRNNPTRSRKVNLTIIVPPQSPVIYTRDRTLAKNLQPFDEDSSLVLVCEVTGGRPPPRVTWHRDGKLIDSTYEYNYDDLTVNRLDLTRATRDLLSAQFVCNASNTHLVSATSAEIIVDVNLKPLLVNITNKTPHLSALMSYEIECVSSGSRPEAVITWWKGIHQIKHMARNFAEGPNMTRSVMSYVPTIEDDGKFLTCRAENPVVQDSALEDKWHLVVHYVPIVTIRLGSSLRATDINEGDDVYFECEVNANPKAYKLGWYKDGRELHHNPAANVILPGGNSLVLQSVNRASAGDYSCMAANYEGKAMSKPVTLDIMYAPICKDGTTTQVVGALKHETISLVCGVQSKPPPTSFQWTFNNSGELMSVPASRYAQVRPQQLVTTHWHGSRLNYTPASDMDYGTIACSARNSIGAQKVPCRFQIIVAGKPYPLQNCSAVQSTGPYAYRMGQEDFKATDARDADWLIVRCSEGFDGGLPITSFELEVYSDENVYHVNTIYINHTDKALPAAASSAGVATSANGATVAAFGPIFEVPGLEPGRNYRLLLYAVNAKGRSEPVVLEPVTLKGVAMYTTGRESSDASTDYSLLVACFAGGITAICILVVGVTLTLYRRNHPLQPSKTQTLVVHYAGAGNAAGNLTPATAGNALLGDARELAGQQRHMQLAQHVVSQEYELHACRSEASMGSQQQLLDVYARAATLTRTAKTTTTTTTAMHELAAEEDPDVIPSTKAERRPDISEPNYAPKPERIKDFRRHLQDEDLLSSATSAQQLTEKDSWLRQNGASCLVQEAGSPSARPSTLPVHRSHDIYTRSLRVQESCI
ncbi:hemicentin-1 isoform X2 [Nasonia vitripennis]|uniref:Ig-like domain-containing protein n=1 Tax=Nasonia vitripennis TaxID=7425 RepID=A0A7M7M762_NASVI|nr:hemicentin-1 isoform X2 [Nasonia vitripennis]